MNGDHHKRTGVELFNPHPRLVPSQPEDDHGADDRNGCEEKN
jgi:hypothetical protein